MSDKEIMLNKKIWAVAGANTNPEKFGNKIYCRLKARGYQVYGVNPVYDEINGDPCYKDLSSLPVVPEVVDIVVSPARAIPIIKEAAKLGIPYIWLQPDTYNDEVLKEIKELGLIAVKDCVLVALP